MERVVSAGGALVGLSVVRYTNPPEHIAAGYAESVTALVDRVHERQARDRAPVRRCFLVAVRHPVSGGDDDVEGSVRPR